MEYTTTQDPVTNETVSTFHLEPTEMRTAPMYTMYFNWSRLIVHGIIPFVMLVYLNAKIYKDIQVTIQLELVNGLREPREKF